LAKAKPGTKAKSLRGFTQTCPGGPWMTQMRLFHSEITIVGAVRCQNTLTGPALPVCRSLSDSARDLFQAWRLACINPSPHQVENKVLKTYRSAKNTCVPGQLKADGALSRLHGMKM
jgi:hypothetical protein